MHSDAEWKAWGKRDPLWAVASWPGREKGGANPWTEDEFYALGRDWHLYERAWTKFGRPMQGTVLEIGCGAGRITRMLARSFEDVIGCDVSADIIAYARARAPEHNIDWRSGAGDRLPANDKSVEAVFSCHVFQHFPDANAQLAMFREIHRVLKPGGTFFVHLPMHAFPDGRFGACLRTAHAVRARVERLRIFIAAKAMRLGGRPPMRMTSHDMDRLIDGLGAIGFEDLAIVVAHRCVYGRKPYSPP